jgi:hypothetical protein
MNDDKQKTNPIITDDEDMDVMDMDITNDDNEVDTADRTYSHPNSSGVYSGNQAKRYGSNSFDDLLDDDDL